MQSSSNLVPGLQEGGYGNHSLTCQGKPDMGPRAHACLKEVVSSFLQLVEALLPNATRTHFFVCFLGFLAVLRCIWDLSSLTED